MSRARHRAVVYLTLASTVLLAGCNQTMGKLSGASDVTTASTAPVSLEALAQLGDKWQANPKDVNRGLAYANGLESVGQKEEALVVYEKLTDANPDNARLSGLYGRKLAAAGKTEQAIPVLEAGRGQGRHRLAGSLGAGLALRPARPLSESTRGIPQGACL